MRPPSSLPRSLLARNAKARKISAKAIVAVVFDPKGAMAALGIQGNKITQVKK